jgi:hypothetical protein
MGKVKGRICTPPNEVRRLQITWQRKRKGEKSEPIVLLFKFENK